MLRSDALRDEISDCQTNRQEKEGAVNVLKEQINTEYLRRTHTSQRMEVLEKEQKEYEAQLEEEQKKRQECSRESYDITAKKDGAQSVLNSGAGWTCFISAGIKG